MIQPITIKQIFIFKCNFFLIKRRDKAQDFEIKVALTEVKIMNGGKFVFILSC